MKLMTPKNALRESSSATDALRQAVVFIATIASSSLAADSAFPQVSKAAGGEASVATAAKVSEATPEKIPFSISVDGQVVDESGVPERNTLSSSTASSVVDQSRKTDADLHAVDIQVKFDGLEQRTLLNVSTMPIRLTYRGGEPVTFLATSNYPAFIKRAEVRISKSDRYSTDTPVTTLPIAVNNNATWIMPDGEDDDYSYVLRVFDEKGRFDETKPLVIKRTTREIKPKLGTEAVSPGAAEDRTAVQNIPVFGGAVTVFGRNVPPGYHPEVFHERVPVDQNRTFVIQRILPPGDHQIDIAVKGVSKSGGLNFNRAINIPDNDWFYIALADLTVGRRFGGQAIETVRDGEYDRVYTKGRAAFYLKGKIRGKYLLTAAADTGEDDIKNVFRGLDAKDPKQLLRRIDPDDYYPVYGDDSVILEDAPTSGKFYVRLDRGDSHVMWGNYKTRISGTEFMRSNRGLYGANAVYLSPGVTSAGEHRTEAVAYAALPETLPQRDEFLATGGSVYFLKHQDVTLGSETLTVEIRDSMTNESGQRVTLIEGEDYSIDYLQGVVILKKPLSSLTFAPTAVRDGANRVYLIVEYEYAPLLEDIDGYVHGGRIQHWVSDSLRLGFSHLGEKTETADQMVLGADFKLKLTTKSFIEGEIGNSKGLGFGVTRSADGGITMSDEDPVGGNSANAWRVKGKVDLADLNLGGLRGSIDGFYEEKQGGFSAAGRQASVDKRIWGAHGTLELSDSVNLNVRHRDLADGEGQVKRNSEVSTSWQIDNSKKVTLGASYTNLHSLRATAAGKSGYDGRRLDSGLRLDYKSDDDHSYYGFVQGTVAQSGDIDRNDRVGLGTNYRLTEKVGISGEASYGTHGPGAAATVSYDPTVDDSYYIGYRLDPDRSHDLSRDDDLDGTDSGTIVGGTRRKINEQATAYAESNYDMFGRRMSLAQTYGVTYTPDDLWTISTNFETGLVQDDTIDSKTGKERSDFERNAGAFGTTYHDPDTNTRGRIRGEARFEDSDDATRDLNTYLLSTALSWNAEPNWRILAGLDGVVSSGTSGSFWNGHYLEASLGFAYRPIDNDRWNSLFKYTYLADLPGNNQVNAASGTELGVDQRSHILSADTSYDLLPWVTIGGKYGFRIGDVRDREEASSEWNDSFSQLLAARADFHIISKWDVLLEGRLLDSPSAGTSDFGFLVSGYRHIGDSFKLGAGYNFGDFSDDLRDLTLNDQGVFVNLVGKY
ncbi:hypothetical protein PDO_4819 [Rhizobium sp. PDO1-076]|uniref:hypothetical protein n=1 Tax=Rhizobium sp. PDO1-076 TaxID=1125979 RepID=UPI00024E3091|nr:hypothetical protein [Rhizobium sp. PDO1-076]EHS52234.1 hypothetical protein PDO_4819 [Rhizobium sp. PDO1-076]